MKDQGTRVVVIGGGGAGLSCALSLLDTYKARGGKVGPGGLVLTVLEAREQLGGRIGSERHGGFSIETGPATLQEGSPGLGELLQRIGLRDEQVFSSDQASRRYIFRSGALRRLPSKPSEVLFSDALSIPARLRLIWEPLVAPAKPEAAETDESVAAFGRRRLGSRVTSELIDPFMSGIFAGDIEKLSLRSTLPRLFQMEAEHRSLFKALKHKQAEAASRVKAGGAPSALPRLFGFRQGIGQLAAALGRSVVEAGGTIRLSTAAQALRRAPGGGAGYEVILAGDGGGERLPAERVVLALPPPDAAALSATLVGLVAFALSLPVASLVTRPLGPLFVLHQGKSKQSFVGGLCTVRTGRVDGREGQALIEDGGAGLLVRVRCDDAAALARGDQAIITAYDPDEDVYDVEPLRALLPKSDQGTSDS